MRNSYHFRPVPVAIGVLLLVWTYFHFSTPQTKVVHNNVEKSQELYIISPPPPAHALVSATESVAEVTSTGPVPPLPKLDQEDPSLIQLVRQNFITEPSTEVCDIEAGPTGLTASIWPLLEKIVKDGRNGFFVEAGAFDGVSASNTIWLERVHDWSGLLVECHPQVVPLLREKHRNAYISDACLSQYSYPTTAELTSVDGWHPSSSLGNDKNLFPNFAKTFTKFQVQTVPLYTLLAAINVTNVDFISLDIQGFEYHVLKHFPFDLIQVKVWLIEMDLMTKEERANLKKLMKQNNYFGPAPLGDYDVLYVHKSIKNVLFNLKNLNPV